MYTQQDSDMLQIAMNSSERFNEDVPTPAMPDLFRDRSILDSILDNPTEGTYSNSSPSIFGHDRAVIEFYICLPGTRPPAACLDSEAILSRTFRDVRDVVFSNEYYISVLQLAQADIAGLYLFWQLKQADLRYELSIVGVGYVKEGATDHLYSYHGMDFPITPKMIQQSLRPAQVQDFNNFPPNLELAVYLDFKVENPINPKAYLSP
jgi:hypothetical protein